MRTEEAKKSASYGTIITNLTTLGEEVRQTSRSEAEAILGIVANLMALQKGLGAPGGASGESRPVGG